jgi:hypothetical protein
MGIKIRYFVRLRVPDDAFTEHFWHRDAESAKAVTRIVAAMHGMNDGTPTVEVNGTFLARRWSDRSRAKRPSAIHSGAHFAFGWVAFNPESEIVRSPS